MVCRISEKRFLLNLPSVKKNLTSGAQQAYAAEGLRDNSSHFVSYFGPCLYTPFPVSCIYCFGCIVCLGLQYYWAFVQEVAAVTDVESAERPPTEEDKELEEMFKMAKSARNKA